MNLQAATEVASWALKHDWAEAAYPVAMGGPTGYLVCVRLTDGEELDEYMGGHVKPDLHNVRAKTATFASYTRLREWAGY